MKRYDDCMEVREEFSALLDGELALEEKERVEGHLSECADCLRELNVLKQVNVAYGALPRIEAPRDFEARVSDALKPAIARFPSLRTARRMYWMRPMIAVAALALLVMGAVFVLQPDDAGRFELASQVKEATDPAETKDGFLADAPESSLGQAQPAPREEALFFADDLRADAPDDAAASDRQRVVSEVREESSVAAASQLGQLEQEETALAAPALEAPARSSTVRKSAGQAAAEVGAKDEAESQERGRPLHVAAGARAPETGQSPADTVDRLEALGYLGSENAPSAEPVAQETVAASGALLELTADRDEVMGEPVTLSSNRLIMTEAMGEVELDAASPKAPALAGVEGERLDDLAGREVGAGAAIKTAPLRSFSVRGDGVWYERGYRDERTTRLKRGSAKLKKLLVAYPDVQQMVDRPASSVFFAGGRWYRLERAKEEP